LRDDIGCGASTCQLCSHLPTGGGEEVALLSATPFRGTYLVLDTNAVLHQMDLLEEDCDALRDVIILQTVMEEVSAVEPFVCAPCATIPITQHSSACWCINTPRQWRG
jgi:hypothetical protein